MSATDHRRFRLGDWLVDPGTGRLSRDGETVESEPKVMALLCLLAANAGEVVSRDEIARALWPNALVNDDALARCVWKLRRALQDDARSPRYLETLSKRGYRLVLRPEPVAEAPGQTRRRGVLAAAGLAGLLVLVIVAATMTLPGPQPDPGSAEVDALIRRADDFYYQYRQADNEAALALYEQALALAPASPPALSGIANGLIQRLLRWPAGAETDAELEGGLTSALASGRLDEPAARRQVDRAVGLATRAVEIDPGYARGYRALGLALSARRDFDAAIRAHNRAVIIDPDAWGALINLADVHDIIGEPDIALAFLEQAHEAMGRSYEEQAVHVRPWYADIGLNIARRHRERGDESAAELTYRRVLATDPFNEPATAGLARLLIEGGDGAAGRRLCGELIARTGDRLGECRGLLAQP